MPKGTVFGQDFPAEAQRKRRRLTASLHSDTPRGSGRCPLVTNLPKLGSDVLPAGRLLGSLVTVGAGPFPVVVGVGEDCSLDLPF